MEPRQESQIFEVGSKRTPFVVAFVVLFFGAVGCFILFNLFREFSENPEVFSDNPMGLIISFSIGAIVFLVFFILIFYRTRYRIDPFRKLLQKHVSFLVYQKAGEEILFSEVANCIVKCETRGSGKNRSTYYPLYIILNDDRELELLAPKSYEVSRVDGERVARAMNVELHDETTGQLVVRKPGEFDLTVRERLKQEFESREQPDTPRNMRSKISQELDKIKIQIPPGITATTSKVPWIVAVVLIGIIGVGFTLKLFPLLLFASIITLIIGYAAFRTETLVVSKQDFAITSGALLFRSTRRIPLDELEELYLVTPSEEASRYIKEINLKSASSNDMQQATAKRMFSWFGSFIVARSDNETIKFGYMLEADELDYILYQAEQWIRS